jgi:hypothetical protein
MHARVRDAHRRIIEDNNGLLRFTRASQNIATAAALLRGLPEPAMPEGRQEQREIRALLERMMVQQAESSASR